jgi:hypothetical protein
MNKIKAVLLFYKKLIVPSLIMSIILGFSGRILNILVPIPNEETTKIFSMPIAAGGYILFSMAFLYFFYEVIYSNEYFFYYNLGLNKYMLIGSTFLISTIIALIILII